MKYIVLLGDGMPDEKIEVLGGKTPLQFASTPNMDRMARLGRFGLAKTVPNGFPPGSDVANLSVFGYDPSVYYTGRSPLEAASIGVELGPEDVAFRLNLVNLQTKGGKLYMRDYSSGHISTEEGSELVKTLQTEFGDDEFQFYPGVSYRHLLVWRNGLEGMKTTPPHDITGKCIDKFLPKGEGGERLVRIMTETRELLASHPVYQKRMESKKLPANSIWLWGQGKAPKMQTYRERFGLTGAVISAVDLIRGIGVYAGLDIIKVPGATGYVDTNYHGKAEAALKALEKGDFVYLHVEAPDESSHSGILEYKIRAIEDFDAKIVGPILEGIGRFGDYRILCVSDHPTPLRIKTHTSEPVPFVIYSGENGKEADLKGFDEYSAKATGLFVDEGFRLMEMMMAAK
ncbi:MAG TPA: cofactor-independent phosphoglycerate mutase [Geobacteraceae bacterium]|nr:cofactor-independent phosphoglycerate mutase [Geobacteraceae bacterium]